MWWRREAVCGLPFYISEPLMWSVFRFAYAQSQAWRSLRCVGLITETKRTGKTQYSRKGSFEGGLIWRFSTQRSAYCRLEGYGNDNPGAKSQGMKQLMAGGGVALIGITLVPLLSGLFG